MLFKVFLIKKYHNFLLAIKKKKNVKIVLRIICVCNFETVARKKSRMGQISYQTESEILKRFLAHKSARYSEIN
jgi:hypothetical protein